VKDDEEKPPEWSHYLGSTIRRQRDERGWSQDQLAQRLTELGFRWLQSTVNRIETGSRTVTWDEAAILSLIFDLNLNELARMNPVALRAQRAELDDDIRAKQVMVKDLDRQIRGAERRHKAMRAASGWEELFDQAYRDYVQRVREDHGLDEDDA
jgi:transcriptional regulator with XRE-family HTH domain